MRLAVLVLAARLPGHLHALHVLHGRHALRSRVQCGLQPALRVDEEVRASDDAVAGLMKVAVEKGRSTRPDLELGICGEHGGDPDSIHKCERIGLDYVSCSPFRVPVARLAAAQAALGTQADK